MSGLQFTLVPSFVDLTGKRGNAGPGPTTINKTGI